MNRKQISIALAAALVATVGITGCKKKEEPVAPPPAAAPAATAPAAATPAAAPVSILSVDLGSAIGADNRISTPTAVFTPTDTLYASVNTGGAANGNKLTANWQYQDGQTVHSEDRTMQGADTVYEFHVTKPTNNWPTGKYRVQVSLDGGAPQTREFEIR